MALWKIHSFLEFFGLMRKRVENSVFFWDELDSLLHDYYNFNSTNLWVFLKSISDIYQLEITQPANGSNGFHGQQQLKIVLWKMKKW